MDERMTFTNASMPVLNILNNINTVQFGGLDLQPDYQRGYIWKTDFKDKLIYSIIKRYPTGNISVRSLNTPNSKGAKEEVVDGQQRLTTIKNFVSNEYTIRSEWSRKIIELIVSYLGDNFEDLKLDKLKKKLKGKGNIRLKFDDLPSIIQGNINAYNIPVTYIANATDVQIREYFRFLQNQERLRAGEIIKSMPATNLECYLNNITDKDKFMDIIGFSDNRAEFDKVFYSVIGLVDGKISFGVTDKNIQQYCADADIPTDGLSCVKLMVEQINHICNEDRVLISLSRKRYLKFLLILTALGYVNFENETEKKLKNLKDIDDMLVVYFSAKLNAVEDQFIGYNSKTIEDLRNIALITKGAHPLSRVKNRMAILAYFVNNGISKESYCSIQVTD
ncbi:putative uncharacterized protein [Clostridium sp. CAG:307]|nr:putative uncharacterized protein [Clostridium sp. CAG:307]